MLTEYINEKHLSYYHSYLLQVYELINKLDDVNDLLYFLVLVIEMMRKCFEIFLALVSTVSGLHLVDHFKDYLSSISMRSVESKT